MEKEPTSRQRQAEATKRRIRTEAGRLILERGYENVTITDICQAAGVSNGNFYHYFKSKGEVLLYMYSLADEHTQSEFSRRTYDSPLEEIRSLICEQLSGVNGASPKIQAQIFQVQLDLHGGYALDEDRFFPACLKELLQEARDKGEIHPSHDIEKVSRICLQLSRGILLDWAMRDGDFDIGVQAKEAMDLLLTSLKQPKE